MMKSSLHTRICRVGTAQIGGGSNIAVQSMCATKTSDIEATLRQIRSLEEHQADLIRVAVDSKRDVEALKAIRLETTANLVVDLQENYRLAAEIAPFVQKFRYNPGHLHHDQKDLSVGEKVKFLVDTAGTHDCAIRIGVNFGSLEPGATGSKSPLDAALSSALEHAEMLDNLGFNRYIVSLKSSSPTAVVEINQRFAAERPELPLHLGVTEAGAPPRAILKTKLAFQDLLSAGIGDTIRVSLTLPDERKYEEVDAARQLLAEISKGERLDAMDPRLQGLNIVSCPSCSRVENQAFIKLSQQVEQALDFAKNESLTIAVMGCRVNGPGETDEADLGLWCAPAFVNLKRKSELLGRFSYAEVVERLVQEVQQLVKNP